MSTVIDEFDTVYAPPDTAIDDGGAEHDSVQDAVDNSDHWVLVGPGTFEENVSISGKDDFDLIGSGLASVIDAPDGSNEEAIYGESARTTIRSLKAKGDANNGVSAIRLVNNAAGGEDAPRVLEVHIDGGAGSGLTISGQNAQVNTVRVFNPGNRGIFVSDSGTVLYNTVVSGAGGNAVEFTSSAIESSLVGCTIRGPSNAGVVVDGDRFVLGGVNILNVDNDGVTINGNDCTFGMSQIDQASGDAIVLGGARPNLFGVSTTNTGTTPLNDAAATSPQYRGVVTDGTVQDNSPVTDSEWVQRLVDSPNGHIMNVVLDNGDSAEIPVPVPDGEDIKVYRWGSYRISDSTSPNGLVVRLKEGDDTVNTSDGAIDKESTDPASPVAQHTNNTGSLSIMKLAVNNGTGSTIADPGVAAHFAYVVE